MSGTYLEANKEDSQKAIDKPLNVFFDYLLGEISEIQMHM